MRDRAPWGYAYIAPVSFFFLFNLSPFVMTHTWGKMEGKRERNRGERKGKRRKEERKSSIKNPP